MDTNQLAVDWLVEKIKLAKPNFKFDSLIRKAKAMEKEQIIDANNMGYSASRRDTDETAEQYYTSTYG